MSASVLPAGARALRILHLEDNARDAELIDQALSEEGIACHTERVVNRQGFVRALEEIAFDLILADYTMPGFNGTDALRLARERHPNVPFIFVTGSLGEEKAIETIRLGATDYVLKDRLSRLGSVLIRAVAEARERAERRRIQESLERSIREQAALLEAANDAIIVRDLDQRITYWNHGAERLYGWTVAEARGQKATELLYQGQTRSSREALQTVLRQGDWQGEMQHATRAGKDVIVNSHWTLLRDEAGQPKSILAINTDLTEKKQIQAQYLRAQRLESIGILAGGIAHDLNNILAPILMAAPMLRSTPPGQTADNLLQTIETSAQRGADLVRQILAFARGGTGEHTELQLRHLVSDLARMIRGTFPRSIETQTAIARDLWPVRGDATQLYQVLMNLCVNARDAMPGGGRLEIRAANLQLDRPIPDQPEAKPGPYVVLGIGDTGTGIPPAILDRIFDPFFTTKEVGKGTGLGLSTVLAIVKNHDGFVTVRSAAEQGSSFAVHLPAIPPAKSQHPAGAEPALPRGRGECLLVIDDEHTVREMTRRVLEFYGYQVLTASNGADAVNLYEAQPDRIALVITDMMMPRMDGATTIHVLRRMNPAVKIIAMSGLLTPGPETEGALATVNAILSKPYPSSKLLRAVHHLLHPPA